MNFILSSLRNSLIDGDSDCGAVAINGFVEEKDDSVGLKE